MSTGAGRGRGGFPLGAGPGVTAPLREPRPDIVFNVAEGEGGRCREAHVPALLEMLGIPYVGSDPLTLCVTLDKPVAKRLVASEGYPTPRFRSCSSPRGGAGAGGPDALLRQPPV